MFELQVEVRVLFISIYVRFLMSVVLYVLFLNAFRHLTFRKL